MLRDSVPRSRGPHIVAASARTPSKINKRCVQISDSSVRSRPQATQDLRALKIERSARPAKRYAVRRWVYAVVLAAVGALQHR
jgi:hypothetical protein